MKPIQDCSALVAVMNHDKAAELVQLGLHAVQHRGPDGAGIASCDGQIHAKKGQGLITEVFPGLDLPGNRAIGQVRMAVDHDRYLENIQPLTIQSYKGVFAIATTGMMTNAPRIREDLEDRGLIFQGLSDAEVLAHLIQKSEGRFKDKVEAAIQQMKGACSFVVMSEKSVGIYRDPKGIHTLLLAKLDQGYVVASESSVFSLLKADLIRELSPGELLWFKDGQLYEQPTNNIAHPCGMEYVYFARQDSTLSGVNVHQSRQKAGRLLAQKESYEADMVIGVPDTAISAAVSFAQTLGLPYEIGLIKNRYIGSTFVRPSQQQREQGMRVRLNAISAMVRGKRLFLVDDSIVNGLTAIRLAQLLKEAGAKEVHLRIASPPIQYPCLAGYEKTKQEKLGAYVYRLEELTRLFRVESLRYLDLASFQQCVPEKACLACFTGHYPIELADYKEEVKDVKAL